MYKSVADQLAKCFIFWEVNRFCPSYVVGEDEEGLEFGVFFVDNVREEHRSEGAVKQGTERKCWIVAFASCRKEDDSFLLVGEVSFQCGIKDVHVSVLVFLF